MDEAEFDAFFHSAFSRICSQVEAMCGDAAEAQDCVQEAFVKAWQRREEFTRAGSREAWVRKVAYHLAVSRWRKHARRRADMPDEVVAFASGTSDDSMALNQALNQLKAKPRRAVVLHYMVGLALNEIADEMEVSVNTVKTWLARSRLAMQQFLESEVASG